MESEETPKPTKPRHKLEQGHINLIRRLEDEQMPAVDAEIAVSFFLLFSRCGTSRVAGEV